MIHITSDFQSLTLSTRVRVQVYLPNRVDPMVALNVTDYKNYYAFEPFRAIYVLHGAWDSAEQWIENTAVMRLAEDANMAIILPSVGNSFYADTLYGAPYEKFLLEELRGYVEAMFPVSPKREDNFLLGVSMGGYGALNAALKRSDLFGACAAMSPTVELSYATRIIRELGVASDGTIGHWKALKGSVYDLYVTLNGLEGAYESIPDILLIIGTEDYLYQMNADFHQDLTERGITHTYKEYPGLHEWKFWDDHLQECIDFLAAAGTKENV